MIRNDRGAIGDNVGFRSAKRGLVVQRFAGGVRREPNDNEP